MVSVSYIIIHIFIKEKPKWNENEIFIKLLVIWYVFLKIFAIKIFKDLQKN